MLKISNFIKIQTKTENEDKTITLGQMEDLIEELDEYSEIGLEIEILTVFSCIWNKEIQMAVTDSVYDPAKYFE